MYTLKHLWAEHDRTVKRIQIPLVSCLHRELGKKTHADTSQKIMAFLLPKSTAWPLNYATPKRIPYIWYNQFNIHIYIYVSIITYAYKYRYKFIYKSSDRRWLCWFHEGYSSQDLSSSVYEKEETKLGWEMPKFKVWHKTANSNTQGMYQLKYTQGTPKECTNLKKKNPICMYQFRYLNLNHFQRTFRPCVTNGLLLTWWVVTLPQQSCASWFYLKVFQRL